MGSSLAKYIERRKFNIITQYWDKKDTNLFIKLDRRIKKLKKR